MFIFYGKYPLKLEI